MLRRLITGAGWIAVGCCMCAAQDPAAAPQDEPNGVRPASPGDALETGRGLELTIEAAMRIALQNNLGLQIEELITDVAYYDYRASYGAFDWVLNARAFVVDSETEAQDIFSETSRNTQGFAVDLAKPLTTGGTFRAQFDTTNTRTDSGLVDADFRTNTNDVVALTYSQPLWRGAWNRYATSTQRLFETVHRRQSERERQVSQQLLLAVGNAYWDLVSAREQSAVADSALELARQQVDQNQRRLDAGVGTEVEVLQAEAEVATREEGKLFVDVRVRQAADLLKQLLFPGKDPTVWETSLVPRTALPEAVGTSGVPAWTDALSVAVEHRPELSQQRLAIDEARIRHQRTRSEKNPFLDLDLAASSRGFDGDSSDAFDTAWQYDFPTYSAALNFNFPLGNTRGRYAEKAAWTELRAARLAYDQAESQIVEEVREAVRQVAYQAEAVRAARKSLELADRQLKAEQARYQEGLSTTFQVLQFQQDYVASLSRERTTRVNYSKALVALLAVQGILGAQLGQ